MLYIHVDIHSHCYVNLIYLIEVLLIFDAQRSEADIVSIMSIYDMSGITIRSTMCVPHLSSQYIIHNKCMQFLICN